MYQTNKEFIEDQFYTLLSLHCSLCEKQYCPTEDANWVSTGNAELDASKMKKEYADKAIDLGWTTNSEGDVICPSCK